MKRTANIRLGICFAAMLALAAPALARGGEPLAPKGMPHGGPGPGQRSALCDGSHNCNCGWCGCDSPGTLFRWGYGAGETGGPDLNEPLVTDRPDFTESSSTVGLGVTQIEMGYTFTTDDSGGIETNAHSYPEVLLRQGILADWLELRVGWNYAHEQTGGVSVSGSEDLSVGLKLGLAPQDCILPELALIVQMTAPTGADAFTAGEVEAGMTWAYSWEVNETWGTGGNTQFNRAIDETGEAYFETAQSWAIGVALSERWSGYVEWFGFFPSGADVARTENFFNGGFTYLVNDNVQLDVRAGVGLNDASDDFFAGVGLSVRWP